MPEGMPGKVSMPTFVFRFEMTKNGKFTGFVDIPDQGVSGSPITDIEMSDGVISFMMPGLQSSKFSGRFADNEIIGKLNLGGPPLSLTLKKGEYVAPVYELTLPKETMDQLLGKWNGKLGPLAIVFRFEKTEKGDLVGFLDSPDQGAKRIPITDAGFGDGKLTLKIASVDSEFSGRLPLTSLMASGRRWE